MSILAQKIDEDTFNDLYILMNKHRWLQISQKAVIELWNLCDVNDQRELLKELLNRFILLDSYELDEIGKKLYEKTIEFSFPVDRTYFVAVADGIEVDGSVTGLDMIKNKFPASDGWKESNFISNIVSFSHDVLSNSNVILFDDFIGSGTKIGRKLKYFLEKMEERKIKIPQLKVFSFAAMELGVKHITDLYKVEVFSPIILKRGITDYNNETESNEKIKLMKSLEKKLSPKIKKLKLDIHSLGYKESEALFGIHGKNCPNNVFPIFWWPEDLYCRKRNTIFTRVR